MTNASAMDLDTFLGDKPGGGGGGGRGYFKWKPKGANTAEAAVWLHTRAPIYKLHNHNWPRVVERKKDDEAVIEVWGGKWVCHEPAAFHDKHRFRNDDGALEMAPRVCPIEFLVEDVRRRVEAGEMDWLEPLFLFEGDDPYATVELRAAGLYNGLAPRNRDLSKEEVGQLKKAGIKRDDAWRQKLDASCNWLFSVVDHADPAAGVQKAWETQLLGDKVKAAIRDEQKRRGPDAGNPFKNPFAIAWAFDKGAKNPQDKYGATSLLGSAAHALTDEVRYLITEQDPPQVGRIVRPGNCLALRAEMEKHAVGAGAKLPFDAYFEAADKAGLMTGDAEGDDDTDFPPQDDRPTSGQVPADVGKRAAPAAPEPMYDCEACAAKECMRGSDFACPACGAGYATEGKGKDAVTRLSSRRCLGSKDGKPCGADVPLPADVAAKGGNAICERCATIHAHAPSPDEASPAPWSVVEAPAQAPARSRRTRSAAGAPPEGQ